MSDAIALVSLSANLLLLPARRVNLTRWIEPEKREESLWLRRPPQTAFQGGGIEVAPLETRQVSKSDLAYLFFSFCFSDFF